jgi:hypothetical protein
MNGLQRLPANEETAILELIRENNLAIDALRCEYTRQTGEGVHEFRGRPWGISYDLLLCKWCGNLEGSANNRLYCPQKMRALRDRLLALPEAVNST